MFIIMIMKMKQVAYMFNKWDICQNIKAIIQEQKIKYVNNASKGMRK